MRTLLFVISLFLCSLISAQSIQVKDGTGASIELPKPAKRIISLAPNLTEILFGLGAGKNLIGVSINSDYPKQVKTLPNVGGYQNMDIEKILSLKPDLVLAWYGGNPTAQINQLKSLGTPVYQYKATTLKEVPKLFEDIGQLTGHVKNARELIKAFHHTIEKYKHASSFKPKVFLQLSEKPLYTVGNKSLINEIIALCGGQNIFNNIVLPASQVTIESVIAHKPDTIITLKPETPKYWERWTMIPAVKSRHLYSLNSDLISRIGPRLTLGIQALCNSIKSSVK